MKDYLAFTIRGIAVTRDFLHNNSWSVTRFDPHTGERLKLPLLTGAVIENLSLCWVRGKAVLVKLARRSSGLAACIVLGLFLGLRVCSH